QSGGERLASLLDPSPTKLQITNSQIEPGELLGWDAEAVVQVATHRAQQVQRLHRPAFRLPPAGVRGRACRSARAAASAFPGASPAVTRCSASRAEASRAPASPLLLAR